GGERTGQPSALAEGFQDLRFVDRVPIVEREDVHATVRYLEGVREPVVKTGAMTRPAGAGPEEIVVAPSDGCLAAAARGRRPEGGLVFATADAYRQGGELLGAVRAVTGAGSIVGCSGAGVLTERGEAEGVTAVAVMVVATGGAPAIRPFLLPGADALGADAGAELSRCTGMAGSEDGCLLILPDPTTLSPDDFLFGLG